MVTSTNLALSAEEQLLINNADWILTKRSIIGKIDLLFGTVCENMKQVIEEQKSSLPETVVISEPKIAKGENYRLLPYVLLDYPRCFDKENVFAVRTMFWWGKFFSITLHLSGNYKKELESVLVKNIYRLQKEEYFICTNEDQWQHHFEPGNYTAVSEWGFDEIKALLLQQSFIKIARKYSLDQWDDLPILLERSFAAMIELITPNVSPSSTDK